MGKEFYKRRKVKYQGEFKDGKWNGKGKEYYQNGKIKYEGEFLNGERVLKNKK